MGEANFETRPKTLILEDDETSRSVFAEIFRRGGYTVVEATTGEGALQELEDEEIGLLVTAVLLSSCSGVEVATEALRRRRNLRVILTSASPIERWPEPDRRAVGNLPLERFVFLPKPLCVLNMLNAAASMFRLRKAA